MIRFPLALVVGLTLTFSAQGAVQTKKITYKDGDVECHGVLAWDDAIRGPRPGVLVVHEWWGLDDYAKKRAEQLAKLGYVAFAADMYGEGKTVKHPKDAGEMAGKVRANVDAWRKRALAALDTLKAQPQCNKDKLAAIGYCFGGSTALQLALAGTDLKAVASFHGALPAPTDAEAKQVKAAILICNGADDTFIPEKAIKAFRDALDKSGTKYEFVNYKGAKHSFTVADADKHGIEGLKYNKEADEDSWKKLEKLLAEKLDK
ncbi:MAG: dienelactone hydrolase family protein [Gemmataceae bacterium]|nr:dienelactone hydrolase family protein [Gemmataceae bacterium]